MHSVVIGQSCQHINQSTNSRSIIKSGIGIEHVRTYPRRRISFPKHKCNIQREVHGVPMTTVGERTVHVTKNYLTALVQFTMCQRLVDWFVRNFSSLVYPITGPRAQNSRESFERTKMKIQIQRQKNTETKKQHEKKLIRTRLVNERPTTSFLETRYMKKHRERERFRAFTKAKYWTSGSLIDQHAVSRVAIGCPITYLLSRGRIQKTKKSY